MSSVGVPRPLRTWSSMVRGCVTSIMSQAKGPDPIDAAGLISGQQQTLPCSARCSAPLEEHLVELAHAHGHACSPAPLTPGLLLIDHLDDLDQLLRVEGFDQPAGRLPHALGLHVGRPSGEHQDGHAAMIGGHAPQGLDEGQAIHPRHVLSVSTRVEASALRLSRPSTPSTASNPNLASAARVNDTICRIENHHGEYGLAIILSWVLEPTKRCRRATFPFWFLPGYRHKCSRNPPG